LKSDIFFIVGGKNFHLPKLIGAFMVFGAILMLFQGVGYMFDVWDSLKDYPLCVSEEDECREILFRKTNIQLLSNQSMPTSRQYWMALIEPVASIFFWAIVFFFGIMFYNTGKIVIPVERSVSKKKKRRGS